MKKQDDISIKYVPVTSLKEADYNPRSINQQKEEQIRKSLIAHGFAQPIVVNCHKGRENIIVGGHQRVRIAKELGIKRVPVVFRDLPPEEEKMLNIRLNDGGDWDYEKMKSYFTDSLLIDTGFGDLIETNDAQLLTRPRAETQINDRESMETVEAGGEPDRNVAVKIGSFITWVKAREYLEWKQGLNATYGFSEDIITRELLRRLGLGEPAKARGKRRARNLETQTQQPG